MSKTVEAAEEMPCAGTDVPAEDFKVVDLSRLEVGALRKYRKHFKVDVGSNVSKGQLLRAVQKHFASLEIDEQDVITRFMQIANPAKRLKT